MTRYKIKKASDFSDTYFGHPAEQLPIGGITSDTSGSPDGVDTRCKYNNN